MRSSSPLSYKTRNTLILLVFVIIIFSVGGYYILYSYPKKIKAVQVQIKKIEPQINALAGIELQLPLIREKIEKEQKKLANLDKQITSTVTSAKTYAYLNNIMKYSGSIKFDMALIGNEQTKSYSYNIYDLKGEGRFSNLYKFIWYLERGPGIYRINRLNLRGVENKDPETEKYHLLVPFEMELWALYADIQDLPPIKRTLADVHTSRVRNPFYPFIQREIQPNVDELIEVERAELKAVIPGKAFVIDHNGNVHVLKVGDKVYLGYVTRIDVKNNEVEFTLNKGGIIENFVLTLRFDQSR